MTNEVYADNYVSSLTAAISSTSRPVTFAVAAISAQLTTGTFSVVIYDAGTDLNPVNAERLKVTAVAGLNLTAVTEASDTAKTHANGSTVRQILTARSMTQQLVYHTDPADTPDPHTQYARKASYTAKGDILVATASGVITRLGVGTDGQTPVADSTTSSGWKWGSAGLASVLQHTGDLIVSKIVGATLGVAARLGIGSLGQTLQVVQNTAAIANPAGAPTVTATGSGGSLANGTNYDWAYAWRNGSSPDGGTTQPSPITAFVATGTGQVTVQAPVAPAAGLTLVIYGALHLGTLTQQATLSNASTIAVNPVNIASLVGGAAISASNTTGGVGPGWVTATVGMTNPMAAVNDLIVGGTAGAPTRLAPGSVGQIVSMLAGPAVGWARALDVMTAVADLVVGGAVGLPTRLAAGATGTVLSIAAGPSIVWARAIDVMTGIGDLITGGAAGVPTRLAPGTAGYVLQSNGAGVALTWVSPVGNGTRLRMSGNQSITTATATVLGWDTEDSDADNQHYTSAANLSAGTVAKTAGSATLVGTSTVFTTDLSVGQLIDVPGTAVETKVIIAITDNTHLVVNSTYANSASGQTATRRNTGVVFRQTGMYDIDLGVYSAAVASGLVQLSFRLNGSTIIKQKDIAGINASAGYSLALKYPFQQWDYIEALWTQNSGGSVNVLADARTALAVNA